MKLLSEIFDIVEKQKNDVDRANLLINEGRGSNVIQWMLRLNYDPNVTLLLPEGTPPYRVNDKPMGYEETSIQKEMKRFYIWLDRKQNLSRHKREDLFIKMLEALHASEATLLCHLKDGKLTDKYPSITEDLVRKTFPNLLPAKQEVVKKKRGRPKKES